MKGKNQKLLLNESVKHLGKVGDVVEVSAGYARNYLLPKGIAVAPTPNNLKKVEERRKEVEREEKALRAKQEVAIKKLEGIEIALERRANEQGHLFGSVGATDISKALAAQGFDVSPEDVHLPGKIDRVDKYLVEIAFAADLKAAVKVYVAPDADSKASMDSFAKEQKARDAVAAAN
jgi:large subunit ribosomal protein L9